MSVKNNHIRTKIGSLKIQLDKEKMKVSYLQKENDKLKS